MRNKLTGLVLCNGMVRSGSTLQYNICRELAGFVGDRVSCGFADSYQELVSRYDPNCINVIKAHSYYSCNSLSLGAEVKRVYIYRDIRDVALSLIRKLGLPDEELFVMLDDAVVQYSKVVASENQLLQRYEDVYRNPNAAVRELADYLGFCVGPDIITEVADRCSVENVRNEMTAVSSSKINKVKRFLFSMGLKRFQVYGDKSLVHHNHISVSGGRPGAWVGELDAELAKKIESRYEGWMREAGYHA